MGGQPKTLLSGKTAPPIASLGGKFLGFYGIFRGNFGFNDLELDLA